MTTATRECGPKLGGYPHEQSLANLPSFGMDRKSAWANLWWLRSHPLRWVESLGRAENEKAPQTVDLRGFFNGGGEIGI